MTDDLTVPALFTVLVGDDPVRRVAVGGNGSRWEMWEGPGLGWYTTESVVHDVRPLIPEGTPVDRIVVKGHGVIEKWIATCDRCGTHTGKSCVTPEEAQDVMQIAGWTAYHGGLNACQDCAPVIAAIVAARAAEPTPDPLEDARDAAIEALMNADDATKLRAVVRALLAATEGDR
jgi:hypothetical protein